MAKKRRKSSAPIREFRAKISKLKKAGLTKVDARSARPSSYLNGLIRKNKDVISGEAIAVQIKGARKRIASDLATRKLITQSKIRAEEIGGRASHGRVIIPNLGKSTRYNEKTKQFETTVSRNGRNRRAVIVPSAADFDKLEKAGATFRVPFARAGGKTEFTSFTSASAMRNFMRPYTVKREGRNTTYADWEDHVLITFNEPLFDEEYEEDEEEEEEE